MCVVAVGVGISAQWRLIVAGNRDEYHARPSLPLHRWEDDSGIIAGRDLVSGGTWMGLSEVGRFAVVTNIRDPDGPDPEKLSRGALVADWLTEAKIVDEPERFNPFNLILGGPEGIDYIANRPAPLRQLLPDGIHMFSNAIHCDPWPRKDRLRNEFGVWLDHSSTRPEKLLDLLSNETEFDRDAQPIFIKSPVYGTRCSTVFAMDHGGGGFALERRFGPDGKATGETRIEFRWPSSVS